MEKTSKLKNIQINRKKVDIEKIVASRRFKLASQCAEVFKKEFDKYIKAVAPFGSWIKDPLSQSNDWDLFVIIDDTDVQTMSRSEVRDRLNFRLNEAAHKIDKRFHVQPMLLTGFMAGVREGHPHIFNALRDGIPVYDVGIFMPMKLMLGMGQIAGTQEAIDSHIQMADQFLRIGKIKIVMEVFKNYYDATWAAGEAAAMALGYPPPDPKRLIEIFDELVSQKIIDKKQAEHYKKSYKTWKDFEHGNIKEVPIDEVDKLIKGTEEFVLAMKDLIKDGEKNKGMKIINASYEIVQKAIEDVMKTAEIEFKEEEKMKVFKEKVLNGKILPKKLENVLDKLEKLDRALKAKEKISDKDVLQIQDETKEFLFKVADYINKKKSEPLIKTPKLVWEHEKGKGIGWVTENQIFTSSENGKLMKAKLAPNGEILGQFEESKAEELVAALSGAKPMEIKKLTIDGLKKHTGELKKVGIEYANNYVVDLTHLIE